MSIVSPLHKSKPIISMKFTPGVRRRTVNDAMKHLNEYNLFLVLEKQRIAKVKELYQSGRSSSPRSDCRSSCGEGVTLPAFPPRYRCLDLSARWIVSEMNKQRRAIVADHAAKEQWRALDRVTRAFLEDAVNVLRQLYSGDSAPARCSTPPYIPTLSPSTITPPSSPLTLPLTSVYTPSLEESRIPAERNEVDMSNDEIMSLWNRAVPSEDGINID